MSRPDSTPAPARRFLHPSSSATSGAASVRRPVPPFSQTRACRVPASRYSRASQFCTRGPGQRDDITTSFEEDETSPSLPPRALATIRNDDDIVHEEVGLPEPPRMGYDDHFNEEYTNAALPYEGNDYWREAELETPMPKRRKVSMMRTAAEPIHISSSPSDTTPQSPTTSEAGADNLSPAKLTTPHTTSRFRAPASIIARDDARPSKPAFKAVDAYSNDTSGVGSVLPEAFTPSRKKGKHDYLHGGLADTLRGWVLNISTDETQHGSKAEREVSLNDAKMDRSRRGITAVDTSGVQWLLAGLQPWSSTSISKSVIERINAGEKVTARGASTTWTVPLESFGLGPDIQAAGQWDLPP